MKHFGERLKQARLKKGYTLYSLGKILVSTGDVYGVGASNIREYEIGKRYPNSYTLHGLCKVLDISADYLLGLKESEE